MRRFVHRLQNLSGRACPKQNLPGDFGSPNYSEVSRAFECFTSLADDTKSMLAAAT